MLLLFAGLAVAWTWPVARVLDSAIPGNPGDNYSFVWNLWWMRHVLATPGLPYFQTTYLFHPFGASIANHPHTALPALVGATTLGRLPPAEAQNLLLIADVFANMAAMYALVWTHTRQLAPSTLAAVIFGLSPYVAVHLLGHFDLVAAWTIPLFALALERALRGSRMAAIAAGTTLAATAYIAYYHLVYQCFFAVVYVAAGVGGLRLRAATTARTPGGRRLSAAFLLAATASAFVALLIVITGGTAVTIAGADISATTPQNALTLMWVCLAVWLIAWRRPRLKWDRDADWHCVAAVAWPLVAVFVLGVAPLLWEAVGLVARGEYVSQRYGWRSIPTGVDLVSPLLGSPIHPLFGALSRRAYAALGDNYIETVAWFGIVPLVLLAGAVARWRAAPVAAVPSSPIEAEHDVGASAAAPVRERLRRAWRAVAMVFAIWALGPFMTVAGFDTGLKLPVILLRFVPFVANARMPGRAMVMVYIALAVLIAEHVAASRRLRSPALQWLLVAVVVFDFWDAPLPMTSLDRPAVYAALAQAEPGAVCEVPMGIGDGLTVGIGSQDRRVLFYATQHEHPLVGGYIGRMPMDAQERYERMPVAGMLLALSSGSVPAADIDRDVTLSPCRYLVVRKSATSAALLSYIATLPAKRMTDDGERELYRLW